MCKFFLPTTLSILGNDHCAQNHDIYMVITGVGTAVIPGTWNSVSYGEETSAKLFTSGNSYSWQLTFAKGSQSVSSSSWFLYCIPAVQSVTCFAGTPVKLLFF